MKYSLHHKPKEWAEELTLKARTVIRYLPTQDQDLMRCQLTSNINNLHNKQGKLKSNFNNELEKYKKKKRIIKQIKEKLVKCNNAIINHKKEKQL